MKNKKFYYTCPIKAFYMSENFGVDFVDQNENQLNLAINNCEFSWYVLSNNKLFKYIYHKFYVSVKSKHIFKPLQKDIVDRCDPVPHNNFYKANIGDLKAVSNGDLELIIIMRDRKQFFMPEVEYD